MNHISTLTVTQQYIQNQVQRVTQKQSEDILQVISSIMAAIDERFQQQEATIHMLRAQQPKQKEDTSN